MNQDKRLEREKMIAENIKKERINKTKNLLKRIAMWGGVFVVLAAMVWGLAKLGSQPVSFEKGVLSEQLSASDHTKGNVLSKIVLVEYSDFQCPACGQFYPVVKEVEQKYSKDIVLVYRNYPLPSHDKSDIAARAAEAAAIQGKFWEMHDKLFENQNSWAKLSNAKNLFIEYAGQIGLDKVKFETDLDSEAVKNKVNKDIASGTASNVDGTPTFFLNGNKLNLQTYADLDTAISDALAQNR
jgi:protein-disulfide isomerase